MSSLRGGSESDMELFSTGEQEAHHLSSSSCWSESDMNPFSTGKQEEHRSPLMEISGEIRNVIYRHALDHALPNLILTRWMQVMQRRHEDRMGHSVATGRLGASSFTNLLLSNRQVYREASYILYQSCKFSFMIAPRHASFLDGCLLSGFPTPVIQNMSYIHRITNIVLKANWDGHDQADILGFLWTNWKDITTMVCDELQGFSGLRRLTLDWRIPNPCDVLQPTKDQWLSISPYFEILQVKRPDIRMEVLAWEMIPWSMPSRYWVIRRGYRSYTQELMKATERLRYTTVLCSNLGYSRYLWPPFVLPNLRHPSHQMPPTSTRLPFPTRVVQATSGLSQLDSHFIHDGGSTDLQ